MLHKFRRAMVKLPREPLGGEVEVDEALVGGVQASLKGSRQLRGRIAGPILVAVEKRGPASGRSRMEVIPDFQRAALNCILKQNMAPGTTVFTAGLKSFIVLRETGFRHVACPRVRRTDMRTAVKSVVP